MSTEPQQSGMATRTKVIITIVAAVLLVALGTCGVIAYFMIQAISQSFSSVMQMAQEIQFTDAVAKGFVDNLAAGQADAAYELTTKGFQKRQTLEEFKKLLEKHPEFKDSLRTSAEPTTMGPPKFTFRITMKGPKGEVTSTLHLLKEDARWKVDEFTIP